MSIVQLKLVNQFYNLISKRYVFELDDFSWSASMINLTQLDHQNAPSMAKLVVPKAAF